MRSARGEFNVADLVTCVKRNGWGSGAIYRVKSINRSASRAKLSLAFGAFPGGRRKERSASLAECRRVTTSELREAIRVLEALHAAEMNEEAHK